MHSHLLLFLLFFFICGGSHGRRLLHHPFFPLTSSRPPAQPPSFAFPKYPSSINQNPFFPSNPASPPPPSSINQKTFPANISSLNRPSSHSPNTKLLQAIAFPILSLSLLSLLLLLFFRRRSHCKGRGEITEGSDSDRLFPPNSGPASSDFLYLGTLLSSRSPELRPLPPLPKPGRSSSDEFYSPTGSPGQKRRSTVSSLTAPSCPSSNAASSPSSSPPAGSSPNAAFFRPPLPPPPPPPSALQTEKAGQIPKPKLKPLHWDKVKASSNRAMIWDQMKASSFQLNEEMIETLFVYDMKKMSTPSAVRENKVLDAKKSQNIAILLRALNVTKEEVCEALSDGNTDALGNELLETLLRMAPSKEEELELREYNDNSPFKLGPAEKFLKAMLEIPFAFKRVEAMHYVANFDIEIYYLKKSFETLEAACEELRNSRLFLKLLEAVLKTGNRMNVGTSRGDAQAFKLDTLLKLVDVKAADGKTTLLHFVVQEIIKAEGSRHSNAIGDDLECRRLGLQIVSRLGNDLGNVKNSASMDCDALSSSVLKLARGIGKVRDIIRLNEAQGPAESNQRFHSSMIGFLRKAEVEVATLQTKESVALSLVREITEYFHGNSAKEAHPFRIFMIVRDFLSILDQVCKEIGRFNERTTFITSAQVVGHTTLPAFPKFPAAERPGCFKDESSL